MRFREGDRVAVRIIKIDDRDVVDGLRGTIVDMNAVCACVELADGSWVWPWLVNLAPSLECPIKEI